MSSNLAREPQIGATLTRVEEKAYRHRPIIVLGMHRSGTSLLAELIDKWGAFGNDQFLTADYRNAQGYWEYEPLVYFNRRLLVSVQSQSFVPPSDPGEATLSERALEPEWRDGAKQLIYAMKRGQRAWYWKDPRLAVTLPFWQKFWDDPIYIIAVRDPADTALSLCKLYKLPLTAGYVLWQRYITSALRHTATSPLRIFVQYERLLSAPSEQCDRLCQFLKQYCYFDEASDESRRLEAMLRVINPGLRTNANQSSFLAHPEANKEQKQLYRYLQMMATDEDGHLESDALDIFPGWRDYVQALSTVDKLKDALVREQHTLAARVQRKLIGKPPADELPW